MTQPSQGYIVLALGPSQYVAMATNLAASIRVMDGKRPICLIHDMGAIIPKIWADQFDHLVGLEPDTRYPHVMNKLRLFDLSPYALTMFVDADCVLVKRDVDDYWRKAEMRPFSITGAKSISGEWKGVNIADVLKQEGAQYLIRMNAGVFCFDKSASARSFFDGVNDFYLRRRDHLNISLYHGKKTQTDELYLGIFMGLSGMDCDNVANRGHNSWMVSTWRAVYCNFEPKIGKSIIYKGDRHILGLPFMPRSVTKLSPTFAHFIGLKPRLTYSRLTAQMRNLEQLL